MPRGVKLRDAARSGNILSTPEELDETLQFTTNFGSFPVRTGVFR